MPDSKEDNLSVLAYRVGSLEESLRGSMELISKKLDSIVEKQSTSTSQQAVAINDIVRLKQDVVESVERADKLEEDLVSLRISFAEKMAYGGAGGAVVVAVVEVIKYLAGIMGT